MKYFSECRWVCHWLHPVRPSFSPSELRSDNGLVSEKLKAISSPYARWVQQVNHKHVKNQDGGLIRLIPWNDKRGRDFSCTASLIYCCENLPEESYPHTGKLATWLKRDDEPSTQARDRIDQIMATYVEIASNEAFNYCFIKQLVSPVEFFMIGKYLFLFSLIWNK